MPRYILIPDSFKGTMSSTEICGIMADQIRRHQPQATIVAIPVADGGEGTVDAFLAAMGGEKVAARVQGPYGKEMDSFYAVVEGGKTAIVEVAACAGLPLVGENRHPDTATTFGVGQLMLDAAQRGCTKIIVGLGGSATNDFAAGAAAAMGIRFYNAAGQTFVPVGGTLSEIKSIDVSGLAPSLRRAEIVVMCDIDNPLYGKNGAAYIFAPQKGADEAMVAFLDGQLRAVSAVVQAQLGMDVSGVPGAGAAGGMGGGLLAFLGARLQMGIDTVLDLVRFEQLLPGTDMVFTGEGKLDTQSLQGKVVIGVARRAQKHKVPVVAVVGDIGDGVSAAYGEGVSGIFSINRVAVPFSDAKKRAREDLALTMDNLMRFMGSLQACR